MRLFERILTQVIGVSGGRVVTVVSSVGGESPEDALDLDLRELPEWGVQAVDDRDAFLLAAEGAVSSGVDDLLLLAPWSDISARAEHLEVSQADVQVPEAIAQEVLDGLPDGGRVSVVVPAAALVRDASRRTWAALMETACLESVIEMDTGDLAGVDTNTVRPQSNIRAALVTFRKGADADVVRLATLPSSESCDVGEVVADVQHLFSRGGGETEYGFVFRGRIFPNAPLNPGYYSPEVERHRGTIGQLGAVVPLSSLFEVCRADDGEVAGPGQILLRCTGPLDAPHFSVSKLAPGDALAEGDLVLRPVVDQNEYEQAFMLAYLESDRAWRLFEAEGGTSEMDVEALSRLPVVQAAEPIRLTLAEIEDARANVRRWSDELEKARKQLLDIDSVGEADLLDLGRRARSRVAVGARMDELGFRIRTQWPWPLAFKWREVEASQPDPAGYGRALEYAETLACYLACMALAAAHHADISLDSVNDIAGRLAGTTRGLSFADWTEVLKEVRGRSFRNAIGENHPFPEISTLMRDDDGVDRALRRLKRRRDDVAHNRGPQSSGEFTVEHQQAMADLHTWVEASEFLSSYPLWLIEEVRWDSFRDRNLVGYRELMGDNELTPRKTVESELATLEVGSLYACGRVGEMQLLRPVLTWTECEQCHRPAVWVLDQYSAANQHLTIRSLDHGHSHGGDDDLEAFAGIGLIPAD